MPDDATRLLKEDHKPYLVTSVEICKDVLSRFTEVADHIDGIIITDENLFISKDTSLSIMVLRGDLFNYPGAEGYCKIYTIMWEKRPLAIITMKVGCWSSQAIVRIVHHNNALRKTVQHLRSWKLQAATQCAPSSSAPLVKNTWKMSDDIFFYMTEFI
jgi:hypothetical protein